MVYPERRHDCRVSIRTLRQRLCSTWRLLSPHLTVLAPCSSRLEPAVFSFSFPHPPLPYPSLSLGSSQPTVITIFFAIPFTTSSITWVLCYSYIHPLEAWMAVPGPSELEAARLPTHPRSSPRLIFTQVGAAIGAGTPSGAPPK